MKVAYLDSDDNLIGYGDVDGAVDGEIDGAPGFPGATYQKTLPYGCDLPTNSTYFWNRTKRAFESISRRYEGASAAIVSTASAIVNAAIKARQEGQALTPEMDAILDTMIFPPPK